MPSAEIEIYAGFDLGGSFLKASSFRLDGALRQNCSMDATQCRKAEDYIALFENAREFLALNERIRGVGIAVAGVLDLNEGRIVDSPNLPHLRDVCLLELLKDVFPLVPIHMMNDANAAALGEYFAGSGSGYQSMFIITLGTGIGGGFIQSGEIWKGASGMAGEIGHMAIERNGEMCNCGARGCLEAYFSSWALKRDAKAYATRHPDSTIAMRDKTSPISLSDLARSGDHAAKTIWEDGGHALGVGIANIMNLVNPESIVLTGGLMKAKEHFLPAAQRAWEVNSFERASASSKVSLGELGEWAGARGAIQPFL